MWDGCLFAFPPLNNSKASPRRSSFLMFSKGFVFVHHPDKAAASHIYFLKRFGVANQFILPYYGVYLNAFPLCCFFFFCLYYFLSAYDFVS